MTVLEPPENEVMDYRGLAVYLKMSENTLKLAVSKEILPVEGIMMYTVTRIRFNLEKIFQTCYTI